VSTFLTKHWGGIKQTCLIFGTTYVLTTIYKRGNGIWTIAN